MLGASLSRPDWNLQKDPTNTLTGTVPAALPVTLRMLQPPDEGAPVCCNGTSRFGTRQVSGSGNIHRFVTRRQFLAMPMPSFPGRSRSFPVEVEGCPPGRRKQEHKNLWHGS